MSKFMVRICFTGILFFCAHSAESLAQSGQADSETEANSDSECQLPALRDELAQRVARDQKARMAMIEGMKVNEGGIRKVNSEAHAQVIKIDRENKTWLLEKVSEHGWLGATLVGEVGAHHAWLLVQHADQDLPFQKKCLTLMTAMPRGEVAPVDIAYLTDRVLSAEGKPQRYGTQCQIVEGKAVVKKVEDPENLDARRADLGLNPIDEYLEFVESVYAKSDEAESEDKSSGTQESGDSKSGETKRSTFSLSGSTSNLKDGTVLYVEDRLSDKVIAEVKVQDNQFELSIKLPRSPCQVTIFTKDFSQYRDVWLVNSKMNLDASNCSLKEAKVTGSSFEDQIQQLMAELTKLPRPQWHRLEKRFVAENPGSIVSAQILSVYATTWGRERVAELFESFSDENKTSHYGKKVAKYLELVRTPKVGEPFVDFEMSDVDGKSVRLSNLQGKLILLKFWSSGCGPCLEELPQLVKTYDQYHERGFEILAVSLDSDREAWLNRITEGMNWIHVSELNGNDNSAALIYGVAGIPDSFLIGRDGNVIARDLRGEKLSEKLALLFENDMRLHK